MLRGVLLRHLLVVVLVAAAFSQTWPEAAASKTAPPRFAVTELQGPEGSIGASAADINERGEVAGLAFPPEGGWYPVRWSSDGRVQTLNMLPGARLCWAHTIDEKGVVAGDCYFSEQPGTSTAVTWPDTEPILLPTASADSFARDANDRGEIAGAVSDALSGARTPVIWSKQALVWLDTISDHLEAVATSINSKGESAGITVSPDGDSHAVRWNRSGEITLLEAERSGATAINDFGDVVGRRILWPSLWPKSGGVVLLYTATYGQADDINNSGTIVGEIDYSGEGSALDSTAFLHDGTTFYRLWNLVEGPNPFSALVIASAINNRGQIVGWARHGERNAAFLLTPIKAR